MTCLINLYASDPTTPPGNGWNGSTPSHIQQFKEPCERANKSLWSRTAPSSKDSYETALLAVGGVMLAWTRMAGPGGQRLFCAVEAPRAPCRKESGHGVSASSITWPSVQYTPWRKYGLKRVAIIDWDVHSRQRTQHLFEEDPRVFFVSLHEDPRYCYPGTGYRQEEVKVRVRVSTLNLPLPSGVAFEYLEVLRSEALAPAAAVCAPARLLSLRVCATEDPLSEMRVTRQGTGTWRS